MTRTLMVLFLAAFLVPPSQAIASSLASPASKFGITAKVPGGFLRVSFVSDSIARVSFAKDRKFFNRKSLCVTGSPVQKIHWSLKTSAGHWDLMGEKFTLSVDKSNGSVQFLDLKDGVILAEGARRMGPALVQGEKTFHIQQQWRDIPGESLYGLGQNQFGMLDLKGIDLDLWQHNTNVAIPFLVSNRGYGIFWDNPSFTRFGDLRDFTPIPSENLLDQNGGPGGLTERRMDGSGTALKTSKLDIEVHPKKGDAKPFPTRWEGFITAPTSGDYLFQCRSNGGIKVWLDNKLIMEHWRQGWLTDNDLARAALEKDKRIPLKIEWDTEQGTTFKFSWKTPAALTSTSLWSEVGDGIDYYFVLGPKLDNVLAGYRSLTGQAPMMPSWAFGLWQSRQRYETAQQSQDAVDGFRKNKIPFDNIVQDWRYWADGAWGSHQFDPVRFPDPEGWIQKLHEKNAHVMISVWGKFYPGTPNFDEMKKIGGLYGSVLKEGVKDWLGYPYTFYDAFNPMARALFWNQMDQQIFRKGIDAWWMDSTEPDLMPSPPDRETVESHLNPNALGSGARSLNAYPLLNSQGIYEGQRKSAPNRRVCILTRSGFAGSQRTASAIWSGDVTANWSVFAKQIPAGLNMSLSGIPYWTTDIGGYTLPRKFSDPSAKPGDEEEWRELNNRWFQFGTFCPLLRSHGELRKREMWEFGGINSPTYKSMLKFDRLRYRLFPYLYSTAWEVTNRGGTLMRPLVMDFPDDRTAGTLTAEYMFGRALLAAPVLHYKSRSREVYLPPGAAWYDFWTGKAAPSGTQESPAPYDSMPLFVRAGSILPLGPELQYISEKTQNPITLCIYEGTDGDFTLYEDDGLTYGYEKGEYSEIPIHWDDASKRLTIGKRNGYFKGMIQEKIFNLVIVSIKKPVGFSFNPNAIATLKYHGSVEEYQAIARP